MMYFLAQAAQAMAPAETSTASYLTQLGVGGILVVIVLQTVFKFLEKMKAKRDGYNGGFTSKQVENLVKNVEILKELVHDLHQWHDVRDEDHVFAWYIRKSLTETICGLKTELEKVANSMEKQNELLRKLLEG